MSCKQKHSSVSVNQWQEQKKKYHKNNENQNSYNNVYIYE